MKYLSASALFAFILAGAHLGTAAPVRRTLSASDPNVVVLQFANVLEQLETTFYSQALSKFQPSDFINAGFSSAQVAIEQITAISQDEATHTTVIQEELVSLGQSPLQCQFELSSALTDVSTMLTVARLVENVGVGAYLGAAHLLTDVTILTAAASIATVEGRHQTILNVFNGGGAIPNAFDLPLLPNEVLSLAGSFIQGCDLGITANTALTITSTQITVGTSLSFSWSGMPSDINSSGLFCQIMAGGFPISLSLPISQCNVPQNVTGPVAVWITSDDQPLNNNARDRSSLTTVAGPGIFFVDIIEEQISVIVRSSSGSSGLPSSGGSSNSEQSSSSSASAVAISNPAVHMIPSPTASV